MNLQWMEHKLHRHLSTALILIAAITLGGAYAAEYIYNLEPCTLCLYQRIPFALIGFLGVIGYIFDSDKSKIFIAVLASLIFFAGSGVATYHVGVEQHWWASTTICGEGAPEQELSMKKFQALLQKKPAVACDDLTWSFVGVSMATFNASFSGFLGLSALWTAHRIRCLSW